MNPQQVSKLLTQAVAHHQAGRFMAALPLYRQVQRLVPKNFDAWHLGGTAALQAGRHAEAAPQLERALQINSDSALALLRLGVTRAALGELDAAAGLLQRAAVRDPKMVEPWEHLAALEHRRGRFAEAIGAAQASVALRPDSAPMLARLSHLVCAHHGIAAALPLFKKATQVWPNDAEAWKNLGTAHANLHQPLEALEALGRAASLQPDLPGIELGLGLAYQESGRISEAVAAYGRVLAAEPAHAEAGSARLLCLNYSDTATPSDLASAAKAYGLARAGAAVASSGPAWAPPAIRSRHTPLKVAIVSPDLRRHAVAQFIAPLLAHLPPGELEIWLYHDHPVEDAVSAALKAGAARWTNLAGLPHDAVRDRLRADQPDILLDLAGHTGFNRLPVFAERAAPVQVSYLGYPNSTGLAEMDYRLTDGHADPAGRTDEYYTEKLVRFSSCAWTFSPAPDAVDVVVKDPLQAEGVVFGSFNTPAKLSDTTLRLWARVLAAVPESRLLLKGHGFGQPAFVARWRERLAALGCPVERVDLVGRITDTGGHLGLYARVDVALDPFPYHGTTTTCEALWQGRPVVVRAGDDHRSRVGVSLLTAAGHPEWIANTDDDYVAIATRLASEPAMRRVIALGLRADMMRGPLFDYAGQARAFAAALRQCYGEKTAV